MKAYSIASHMNGFFADPQPAMDGGQSVIARFFRKIDRLMTAIAHAEAGNFDAVQRILELDQAGARPSTGRGGRVDWC